MPPVRHLCLTNQPIQSHHLTSPPCRQSFGGQLESPVIRIHGSAVRQADFFLDQTPSATPRPDDTNDGDYAGQYQQQQQQYQLQHQQQSKLSHMEK
jgi:hypothetical protein